MGLEIGDWFQWNGTSKRGELVHIDPGKTFVTLDINGTKTDISMYTFQMDWKKTVKPKRKLK